MYGPAKADGLMRALPQKRTAFVYIYVHGLIARSSLPRQFSVWAACVKVRNDGPIGHEIWWYLCC